MHLSSLFLRVCLSSVPFPKYQVKSEETNSKRTVMNSVIGTLDISIRYLLHGETFPGVWHDFNIPLIYEFD